MDPAQPGLPIYMAQQTITRADVGLRSARGPILGAVMLVGSLYWWLLSPLEEHVEHH